MHQLIQFVRPARDARLMAVNIWVALHRILSCAPAGRPTIHAPVETLIDAALVGPSRAGPRNITTR